MSNNANGPLHGSMTAGPARAHGRGVVTGVSGSANPKQLELRLLINSRCPPLHNDSGKVTVGHHSALPSKRKATPWQPRGSRRINERRWRPDF